MVQCCVIITTTDKLEVAREISRSLVQAGLSKCVQISKIESIYIWEGKTCESEEYRLMVKALQENLSIITTKILAIHNYSVPEIISLDICGGYDKYLDWIKA